MTGVFGSMIFCQYSLLTLFSCPLYSRETLFTLLLFLVVLLPSKVFLTLVLTNGTKITTRVNYGRMLRVNSSKVVMMMKMTNK